jgi:arylsulfatase A-like enzyme
VLRRCLLLLAVVLGGLPVLGTTTTDAQALPPDIIVILLDDARKGDIEQAMPKTQALLPDGTWFPNFILTTPLCCPSRATLLTGRYAHNHQVYDNSWKDKRGGWRAFRPNEDRTLAVALNRVGYRTALVTKYMNEYDRRSGAPPGWDDWHAANGQPQYVGGDPPRYLPDVRAKKAEAIAANVRPNVPLFLWYAEIAPHDDHGDPPPAATRHRKAFPEVTDRWERARLRSILSIDDGVARIAALGQTRWGQACVAVLSDNGFMMGEHRVTRGKAVPYDAAARVPMLLRCPGIAPGKDTRLAANIDLAPTLARAAGIELNGSVDGRALQDSWDRERVLLEGWADDPKKGIHPFSAVRTVDETYVEYENGTAVLWDRRVDDEETDQLGDANAAQWASWLEALRECAGETCRQAEDGG